MATTSALPHGNETPCPGDCRLARVGTLDQPKDRQTDGQTDRGRKKDRYKVYVCNVTEVHCKEPSSITSDIFADVSHMWRNPGADQPFYCAVCMCANVEQGKYYYNHLNVCIGAHHISAREKKAFFNYDTHL